MTRLLFVLLLAAGCSTLKPIIGFETERYDAVLCGTGAVTIPCKALGALDVPKGGDALVTLMVVAAGPYLAQQAALKGCLFTTYPEVVDRTVTVSASATCKLRGVPVRELVTLTLTPTAGGSP